MPAIRSGTPARAAAAIASSIPFSGQMRPSTSAKPRLRTEGVARSTPFSIGSAIAAPGGAVSAWLRETGCSHVFGRRGASAAAGYQASGRCSVASTAGPGGGRYSAKSMPCRWTTSTCSRTSSAASRSRTAACARARVASSISPAGAAIETQLAADRRPFDGDHDRPMTRRDDRAIELREHLLRTTDRIEADRRERIGDADDGQRAPVAATAVLHVARPLVVDERSPRARRRHAPAAARHRPAEAVVQARMRRCRRGEVVVGCGAQPLGRQRKDARGLRSGSRDTPTAARLAASASPSRSTRHSRRVGSGQNAPYAGRPARR